MKIGCQPEPRRTRENGWFILLAQVVDSGEDTQRQG
jgi:hypothetical protein